MIHFDPHVTNEIIVTYNSQQEQLIKVQSTGESCSQI